VFDGLADDLDLGLDKLWLGHGGFLALICNYDAEVGMGVKGFELRYALRVMRYARRPGVL